MTHVLRYLLIFGDRKKKVELTVSQEIENVKVETLKQKAKELFNLKNVILQIWDKGFEDWVDLDEGDPTPTNSRIKVEIDKEARSLADIAIAQRRTSSVPGASPTVVLSAKKPDPPVLQVISSQPAYPPVALATTGVSLLTGAPQSFPPVACLPSNTQTVSAKPSSGVPQKILPVGQRPYRGEQSPGSKTPGRGASSSSSVGKLTVNLGDVQDDSDSRSMTECSIGTVWSVIECKHLIGIWCSDDIQLSLIGLTRNKSVYKKIALSLADAGFHLRPWARVRDKVNRMKTEYRKIRRQLANGCDEDRISYPTWYQDIHAVFGTKLSAGLPDVVDDGDHDVDCDDLSSTMQEDRDECEDRISDDEDNYSADSRETGQGSGQCNSMEQLASSHIREKATKGGSIHDGDSVRSNEEDGAEDNDAWIVQGISDETENQGQDDTQDGSTDKRVTRGVKRGHEDGDKETSKRGSDLVKVPFDQEENREVEGEKDGHDEKDASKGYYLRKIKLEVVEHEETFE